MGYQISDEERERRSLAMKALHESGKLDAKRDGSLGGKAKAERQRRLNQRIIDKFDDDDAEMIYKRLKRTIRSGSDRDAMTAVKTVLVLDDKQHEIERKEERELEHMEQAELLAYLVDGLREIALNGSRTDPVDAEWSESPAAIGPGEADRSGEEETRDDWTGE